VYYGSASGIASTQDLSGAGSGQWFGSAVAIVEDDVDGDGHGEVIVGASAYTGSVTSSGGVYVFDGEDIDGDGYLAADDCDDSDPNVNPSATEEPGDGLDNDCLHGDRCYVDTDHDGYGTTPIDATATPASPCTGPEGSVAPLDGDCDDTDANRNPGEAEIAGNGVDEDCSGTDDCYVDSDGDGHGDAAAIATTDSDCSADGEALYPNDCDDGDDTVHEDATEATADGIDQDCNGQEICFVDNDGDGEGTEDTVETVKIGDLDCSAEGRSTSSTDCDDGNAALFEGNSEVVGDGFDQDCDGVDVCYVDFDNDGYGRPADVATPVVGGPGGCIATLGMANVAGDCDDEDDDASSDVHPGAEEIVGDNIDQDCDTYELCHADADGDGYGSDVPSETAVIALSAGTCAGLGYPDRTDDCKDAIAAVHPDAPESVDNGIDEDCDGGDLCFQDEDDDGHRPLDIGAKTASDNLDCSDPYEAGQADPADDCDDTNGAIHPEAEEHAADGVDQNCNGYEVCYVDGDLDGVGTTTETPDEVPLGCISAGHSSESNDCDDANPARYPGATETAADGIDQDCDNGDSCYADADGDGYYDVDTDTIVVSEGLNCDGEGEATPSSAQAGDCDDGNAAISPEATELCNNVDENCDGDPLDGYFYADPNDLEGTCDGTSGPTFLGCAHGGGWPIGAAWPVLLLALRRGRRLRG
jgi:hypothetical protein